jgi:hypothetical protein
MQNVRSRAAAAVLTACLGALALCACAAQPAAVSGALWEHDLSDTLMGCLALSPDADAIVAAGVFGSVSVISADGAALWSTALDSTAESFMAPPVFDRPGEILLLSESGHLFCYAGAGSSWALKWSNTERTLDISTPLQVQDAFVYAYHEKYGLLAQISRDTGQTIRELELAPPRGYASAPATGEQVVMRVVRAGATRLFVFTVTYDAPPESGAPVTEERASVEVLDAALATVARTSLGSFAVSTPTPTSYPFTYATLPSIEYPVVEGDTARIWMERTTAASAAEWENDWVRRDVDASGAVSTGQVISEAGAMTGYWMPEDGLFDASGGVLVGSMSYSGDSLQIQHAVAAGGSVTAELMLDLGLPSGWKILAGYGGSREDGLWDANGDYWFSCVVGIGTVTSQTRIYRFATRGVAPGTSSVSPDLVATLPSPAIHTNILMLPDGRLVIGAKDGRIFCFQTTSPGVDPAAPRPVYYQAQTNRGRR